MRLLLPVLAVAAATAALVALWPRADNRPPVSACGPVDAAPAIAGLDAAATATLCLLNQERTSRGLPAFATDGLLAQAAREHSEDMVRRAYFEHTTPDGRTVQDRIRASGWASGASASTGENIQWGLGAKATPTAIVKAWMASPPHRADILRPAFTTIGIGIALGVPDVPNRGTGEGATYTTDFGGPIDPSLPSG